MCRAFTTTWVHGHSTQTHIVYLLYTSLGHKLTRRPQPFLDCLVLQLIQHSNSFQPGSESAISLTHDNEWHRFRLKKRRPMLQSSTPNNPHTTTCFNDHSVVINVNPYLFLSDCRRIPFLSFLQTILVFRLTRPSLCSFGSTTSRQHRLGSASRASISRSSILKRWHRP